jgi:hypothetical protein
VSRGSTELGLDGSSQHDGDEVWARLPKESVSDSESLPLACLLALAIIL